MSDLLETISIISFVLCVIFLILTILLWFKFKIPNIISYLKGKETTNSNSNVSKENQKLNIQMGSKFYYSSSVKTDSIPMQNKHNQLNYVSSVESTELLSTKTIPLESEQTLLLEENETTLLTDDDLEATTLLSSQEIGSEVMMIDDIVMLHTREIIPLNMNYGGEQHDE